LDSLGPISKNIAADQSDQRQIGGSRLTRSVIADVIGDDTAPWRKYYYYYWQRQNYLP